MLLNDRPEQGNIQISYNYIQVQPNTTSRMQKYMVIWFQKTQGFIHLLNLMSVSIMAERQINIGFKKNIDNCVETFLF